MASPETESSIEHIIEIPKEIEPALYDVCCIYKVPVNLRKLNNGEAYTPQLISIGPFHHKNSELKSMHKQKQRYFLAFCERVINKKALAEYKTFLKENIEMIRHCYSEPDDLNNDEFVDMILLDSVFILELFLRKQAKDYMFTTPWIKKSIQRDLLLLENQLPIFVLEKLYGRLYNDNGSSFLELALNYFEDYKYNPHESTNDQDKEMIENCKQSKHFTDLIRYFYLPKHVHVKGWMPASSHFTPNYEVLRTATKLNEAGVSFEKVHSRSLLEIKFKKIPVFNWFLCLGCLPCFICVKSRLQIPQFKVFLTTECVLRNLIALEQCYYPNQPFICNYVSLIDSLINTHEDVELLVDKEIIVHKLGSHTELATMINGLCKHLEITCDYYSIIIKELNDHYNSCWKHYMGMLKSVYFRDPWRLSSTFVGVAIFLFAIVNFLRITNLFPRH